VTLDTHVARFLSVASLFVFGVAAGAATARGTDPYAGLDSFARALSTIEGWYVEKLDRDALLEAAVRGMVDSLDPHSAYMSPEEAVAFREDNEGAYVGIGVEVRRVPDGVLVADVLPGGPAQRDGVQAGDIVVAVDDHSLAGLDLDDVGALLEGPRGSSITLSITRAGWDVPRPIVTARDRVVTPAVATDRLPSGIVWARIVQFQDGTARELTSALSARQTEAPMTGLVLDLRDDPGGLLDEAVGVTDLFLDTGPIVSTRGRSEGNEEFLATPGGLPADLRVVVLVNGLSASASEIVTGALQDTGRATIVGTHTYGKGSVQVVFEAPNRSALRLTTARYYTPSGEPVAPEKGRAPDVVVEMPAPHDPEQALRTRIEALELPDAERTEWLALLDELPDTRAVDPIVPWRGSLTERRAKDPQLDAALSILERAR